MTTTVSTAPAIHQAVIDVVEAVTSFTGDPDHELLFPELHAVVKVGRLTATQLSVMPGTLHPDGTTTYRMFSDRTRDCGVIVDPARSNTSQLTRRCRLAVNRSVLQHQAATR
jgi:hypothetical protein